MNNLVNVSQKLGLHPLVGFGMFAVDMMLFGGTVVTLGTGLVVTIPVALGLAIPCALIQKYSFGDEWGLAIGKGMIVGVLTAIPTPIPGLASIGGGVVGATSLLMAPSSEAPIETERHQLSPGENYEVYDNDVPYNQSAFTYAGHKSTTKRKQVIASVILSLVLLACGCACATGTIGSGAWVYFG